MLFLSFFLLLTNLSALALATDYPFNPDGSVKPKGQAGNETTFQPIIKNTTDNTYFDHGTKMTTLGRPEVDVAIARAKALNASRTIGDAVTHVEEAKRGTSAGVYMCNGSNWKGGCWYTVTTGGRCHNVHSPYGSASSFGADANVQCVIYNQPDCRNGFAIYDKYTWPGTGNLNLPTQWYGKPQSYMCRWCYGCFYGKAPHWVQSMFDSW